MRVENKGLSLTLHYREHPDVEEAVVAWAAREAGRSGLVARSARMSVELHPPIEADKGTAIEKLSAKLDARCSTPATTSAICPPFDALDRLEAARAHRRPGRGPLDRGPTRAARSGRPR